ncbi:peptidoglycan-binding protein [Streptomyces viridiviolaceus]|uniref:Peptidoglycan-binding protein n=1 Tax=Streptomyces viridiviolaceus TaxID=68282 RepID=A0ABW2DS95_9ACTN|nr:peptidoglycan-binding protein [Streptomyces viridiviolaceus]GHB34842.1 peptidoglycan-binding protein [Streptomyces viridiviolaceus]
MPRRPDNTPSCVCGPRASDALRDARTAQAAAAEDFDPLRIRPYVELDGSAGAGPSPAADPDATVSLRAVGTEPPGAESTSVLPTPLAAPAGAPSDHDLRLFETASAPVAPGPDDAAGPPPHRRRRGMLLSVAGAVVVVIGAAGYAAGLFSYETPSRDGALPDEVRASVPDPSMGEASAAPAPSTASARPTSASPSPSASASASASPSPSPSPSASSASPTPSRSAEPTQSATTPSAGGDAATESHDDDQDHDHDGGGLRRGDRGPDVAELQQRLQQLHLYTGDVNGNYNRQVEDAVRNYQWARGIRSDEFGVYGEDTRRMLEAETREP